jgi:anti-sigma factor RsiW
VLKNLDDARDRRQLNRLRSFIPHRETQVARLRDLASSQHNDFDYWMELTRTRDRQLQRLRQFAAPQEPRRRRRRKKKKKRRPLPPVVRFLLRHAWILLVGAVLSMGAMAFGAVMVLLNPSFSQTPPAPPGRESVERAEKVPLGLFGAIGVSCATGSLMMSKWLKRPKN